MKRVLLAFTFALGLCGRVSADDPMIEIVYRQEGPNAEAGSPAAQPTTLYRWQSNKGRIEKTYDPAHHQQDLFIANGADGYFIDRVNRTGKHLVDPSPDHNFYCWIAPTGENGAPAARDLEMGHELDYIKKYALLDQEVLLNGQPAVAYSHSEDGYDFIIYVSPKTRLPIQIDVSQSGKLVVRLIYLKYLNSLPPVPALFRPAPDMKIVDEKMPTP